MKKEQLQNPNSNNKFHNSSKMNSLLTLLFIIKHLKLIYYLLMINIKVL